MGFIPGNYMSNLTINFLDRDKARSDAEMAQSFQSQLTISIKNQIKSKDEEKAKHKKITVQKFLAEESDSGSDKSFEESFEQFEKTLQTDPKKDSNVPLIDIDLINLLKFCNELHDKYKLGNEDYQDDVMMKSFQLGLKAKQKVLVFDMDETLISAKFKSRMPDNFATTFTFDYQGQPIHVSKRPFVEDCLMRMADLYEIVVFTAGVQDYADPILNYIDPEKQFFKKRLYRTDCIQVEEYFIKDLDIFLDREKKDIIIVDNSIMSFAFDLDNGVPINSYMGTEEDDRELLYLISFLEEAFYQDDVRTHIFKSFQLSQLQATVLNP